MFEIRVQSAREFMTTATRSHIEQCSDSKSTSTVFHVGFETIVVRVGVHAAKPGQDAGAIIKGGVRYVVESVGLGAAVDQTTVVVDHGNGEEVEGAAVGATMRWGGRRWRRWRGRWW